MTAVSFLNYGLIGLCGLIIFLFSQIIGREQKRKGDPRPGIMKSCWMFLVLGALVGGIGLTLELERVRSNASVSVNLKESQNMMDLKDRLEFLKTDCARLKERVEGREMLLERAEKQLVALQNGVFRLQEQYSKSSVGEPARIPSSAVGLIEMLPDLKKEIESIKDDRKN